jgi:hypothetical protein
VEAPGGAVLRVTADFIEAAGLKLGDEMELRPVFLPGVPKPRNWVLKKHEEPQGGT